ncbi:MAG: hypothetical protein C5B53_01200 [Candidatus Melainabacteria bacterium]|nr:MAG: hypothetical protein C5B53_01200 [Candidatus Melainabacteria bacterium]
MLNSPVVSAIGQWLEPSTLFSGTTSASLGVAQQELSGRTSFFLDRQLILRFGLKTEISQTEVKVMAEMNTWIKLCQQQGCMIEDPRLTGSNCKTRAIFC